LVRDENIQVLHGFDPSSDTQVYLKSDIFNNDVLKELASLLEDAPEVRIYSVF